jgi:hypothetical protein
MFLHGGTRHILILGLLFVTLYEKLPGSVIDPRRTICSVCVTHCYLASIGRAS